MHYLKKFLFVILFFLCKTTASTNISVIINKTNSILTIAYPIKVDNIDIINSKSIIDGKKTNVKLTKNTQGTNIIIPPNTYVSLNGIYIPKYEIKNEKMGINIGTGSDNRPLHLQGPEGGKNIIALIQEKNGQITEVPVQLRQPLYRKRKALTKENDTLENNYILEIDQQKRITLMPQTQEKVKSFINPAQLPPKDFLHQAILNDSPVEIDNALKLGADIDRGVGNQPPLLLAILSKKYRAAKELLARGANPNVEYTEKPLFLYVTQANPQLLSEFTKQGLKLTEKQKKEAVNLIMFRHPSHLDQSKIDVLKFLDFNISENFKNSDLNKNLWYRLLHNNLGTIGRPNEILVRLFLKNGANPNQIFEINGTTWTPLLLLIRDFIKTIKIIDLKPVLNPHYFSSLKTSMSDLIKAGADINMLASPNNKPEPVLSYALKRWNPDVIKLLVDNGAAVDKAIKYYLASNGLPNKEIGQWKRILWWVVDNNSLEGVRLLLEAGAYLDHNALQLAIKKGNDQIIELLMSYKKQKIKHS